MKLITLNKRVLFISFFIFFMSFGSLKANGGEHLIISFDKLIYQTNKIITFTVKNRFDKTIWYKNHNCHFYPALQRFQNQEWRHIDLFPNRMMHCNEKVRKIEAGKSIKYGGDKPHRLEPGRYRYQIIYYIQDITDYPEGPLPSEIKWYTAISEEFVVQDE